MGMFRKYSTIIHLPGGKDFFPLISFSVWIRNKTPGKTSCKTKIRKPIHKILGNTSGVKHRSLGFSSWWLFSDLLLQLCHHYFINCFQYEWMERQCKNCKMNIKSDNSRTFINHMENHMENHFWCYVWSVVFRRLWSKKLANKNIVKHEMFYSLTCYQHLKAVLLGGFQRPCYLSTRSVAWV